MKSVRNGKKNPVKIHSLISAKVKRNRGNGEGQGDLDEGGEQRPLGLNPIRFKGGCDDQTFESRSERSRPAIHSTICESGLPTFWAAQFDAKPRKVKTALQILRCYLRVRNHVGNNQTFDIEHQSIPSQKKVKYRTKPVSWFIKIQEILCA